MKDIIYIRDNPIIQNYLIKPSFLDNSTEKKLILLLKESKMQEFYNAASEIIKSTKDVTQLYMYLLSKANIDNEEFKNFIAYKLFNISKIGWLEFYDMQIIDFCKELTNDKVLLKQLNKIKQPKNYEKYLSFIQFEKKIETSLNNLEDIVLEYIKIKKILTKKQKETIMNSLKSNLLIKKNYDVIGSLISRELQRRIGQETIYPKIEILQKG